VHVLSSWADRLQQVIRDERAADPARRLAMQPNARASRFERSQATRTHRSDDAGQHVASSADASQAGTGEAIAARPSGSAMTVSAPL
jgi:hypothetical protein